MLAYLITGNAGSGKSTVAVELRRRGLIAVNVQELAFWADDAGLPVDQPAEADDHWRPAHRWVWSRARIEQSIDRAARDADSVFFCGIAHAFQSQMLALGAIPLDATGTPHLIADALMKLLPASSGAAVDDLATAVHEQPYEPGPLGESAESKEGLGPNIDNVGASCGKSQTRG